MTKLSRFAGLVGRGHPAWVLLAGLALAGCDLGVEGNGERAEETRQESSFQRVRNDSELDVQISQGDEQRLVLSLDSNLLEHVRTRVDGDTLYISTSEDVGDTVSGPHLRITLPSLSAAKLAGSGEMRIRFDQPDLPLDVYLSGSGDLRFEGKTAALGAYLSGSGDVQLEGETSDLELGLTGSGDISARQLTSASADIRLSGSGDIDATVRESARLALTGSGDLDLYGGAELEIVKESGSGDIDRH